MARSRPDEGIIKLRLTSCCLGIKTMYVAASWSLRQRALHLGSPSLLFKKVNSDASKHILNIEFQSSSVEAYVCMCDTVMLYIYEACVVTAL